MIVRRFFCLYASHIDEDLLTCKLCFFPAPNQPERLPKASPLLTLCLQAWVEDVSIPGWISGIFQLMLGGVGPSPPTARFSGIVANAVENEPFFMGLAIAVATLGNPGEARAVIYISF